MTDGEPGSDALEQIQSATKELIELEKERVKKYTPPGLKRKKGPLTTDERLEYVSKQLEWVVEHQMRDGLRISALTNANIIAATRTTRLVELFSGYVNENTKFHQTLEETFSELATALPKSFETIIKEGLDPLTKALLAYESRMGDILEFLNQELGKDTDEEM